MISLLVWRNCRVLILLASANKESRCMLWTPISPAPDSCNDDFLRIRRTLNILCSPIRPIDSLRIKTVYLLGKGWTTSKVAEALLIDRETVRNHFKRYRKGGIEALRQNEAGGSQALLNEEEQQRALDRHLKEHLYLTAKEIARYVKQTWGVSYSESGITQLLKRMGYVYKKPKLVPGKTNAEKQREFIKLYHELKATKAPEDTIYFMDAVHPQHNPIAGYGWIKRGQDREIRSNTGRRRLNINGVIDCVKQHAIVRYDDTINAQSTIALFQQIEAQHPHAGKIDIDL
ncbi:IS630 family transposase [Methylotuvimicrobium sp. KM1]|uniref:IS630 family transposase n=1 Tax=Methylotuvimicrobium sp. KM1 TaxID=3377707 RepID=UPI00384CA6EB